MSKVFCEELVNGVMTLRNYTVVNGVEAYFVKVHPGPGKPFWCWPSIQTGKIIGCDFTYAPFTTDNVAQNQASIGAITTQPAEVLIYEQAPG